MFGGFQFISHYGGKIKAKAFSMEIVRKPYSHFVVIVQASGMKQYAMRFILFIRIAHWHLDNISVFFVSLFPLMSRYVVRKFVG